MRKTTGISLMLLIFLTLCLVTFSLLSLSGATADEKLSQEAADRTLSYYQAETKAYQILSVIDDLLAGYLEESEQSDSPEDTFLSARASLPEDFSDTWQALNPEASDSSDQDTIPELFWDEENEILSFDTAVTTDQVLHAEISVSFPESAVDPLYTILAWQTVNTEDWNADQALPVYQR